MKIIKGKITKPQRVVIYGPEGIGKTTLASKFPNPLFIDTEGSTEHLDVARTDKPSSWSMLKQMLGELRANTMGYQTVVIDTADWAERLCATEVCAQHQKNGLEEFGYGKGYIYLAEEVGRLLDFLTELTNSGLNVVLTAHTTLKKFEQPDEIGSYDRYELKLEKKTSPLLKEWADMVLFANYKTIVTEIEGKKKVSGGQRVMYTSHRPTWDAKNRHNLPDELPFNYESIAHCIPVVQSATKQVQSQIDSEIPVDLQPAPEPEKTVNPKSQVEDETAFNGPLYDLMKNSNITEEEIRKAVAAQGYYPEQTPIDNYDTDFVMGRLVGNWDAVVNYINTTIRGAK